MEERERERERERGGEGKREGERGRERKEERQYEWQVVLRLTVISCTSSPYFDRSRERRKKRRRVKEAGTSKEGGRNGDVSG